MTIDERLDRLTDDLVVLKQVSASNESNIRELAHSVHELRDSIRDLREGMRDIRDGFLDLRGMQAKNEVLMAKLLLGIDEIGRAVLNHEGRISDLEGDKA